MSAKLIESMIPDSLRLAGHPDAELVNRAIATVIVAMDESSAMTLRGMAKDVRRALEGYYQGVYQPHIAKEDEDWTALKTKAARAPTQATFTLRARLPNGAEFYTWQSDDGRSGSIAASPEDAQGNSTGVIVYDDNGAIRYQLAPVAMHTVNAIRYAMASINPPMDANPTVTPPMMPTNSGAWMADSPADGTGLAPNTTIDNMSVNDQRAGIE